MTRIVVGMTSTESRALVLSSAVCCGWGNPLTIRQSRRSICGLATLGLLVYCRLYSPSCMYLRAPVVAVVLKDLKPMTLSLGDIIISATRVLSPLLRWYGHAEEEDKNVEVYDKYTVVYVVPCAAEFAFRCVC